MSEYKPLPSTTGPPQPDTTTKPSFPITAPGARSLNGGGFGKARWAAATAKINIEHKPTDSKPMSLAEVVQAKVRMNRWEKMKRGLKKRYSTINVSRGMPPIFGFFGKVTAKGKKALLNSFVLLIINLVFLTGCAFAFVAIENNEKFRLKAIGGFLQSQGDLKYFLNKTHDPLDEDGIPHRPGMTPWDEDKWAELKNWHGKRCFKLDNRHTQKNLWNFWSSLDFCATVLTTIGYGSMSPRTHAGKWFTLCYSVIGIPIMAMYLALFSKGIVAFLSASINLFSSMMSKVNRKYELRDMTTRVFSLFVLLLALVIFVCMWSGILNKSNPADSFVKCMYFYVITLTTVGLGDISMTEAQPFVLIRVLFLFCIGLTLVTSVFNAIRSVSAAHTRMLKAQGRRLTSKAQEVVMDGANKLIRHNNNTNNGDGQTDLLTKDDDMENGTHEMVETTFMAVEEENAGFNSNNHYNPNYHS